jgi:hypothetical protein
VWLPICLGSSLSLVPPSPSWWTLLRPQHQSMPWGRAQVWETPAEMTARGAGGAPRTKTVVGRLRSMTLLSPICP